MGTSPTMGELVDRFLSMQSARQIAATTYRDYVSLLTRLAESWDKTRKVPKSLDSEWMFDWLQKIRAGEGGKGEAISDATFNGYLQKIRKFINYLVKRGIVDGFVLDVCQPLPPTPRRPMLRLPVAQMIQAVETPTDPLERWLLAFASQTAGRVSELRSRRVRDLNIPARRIDWVHAKNKKRPFGQKGISERLFVEWQRWEKVYVEACGPLQDDWFLLPRRDGAPRIGYRYTPQEAMSSNACGRIIKKYTSLAAGVGAEFVTSQASHITRRSSAYGMYIRQIEKDISPLDALENVRVLLNHSSVSVTMDYIGVNPQQQRVAELLTGSNILDVDVSNVVQLRPVAGEAS